MNDQEFKDFTTKFVDHFNENQLGCISFIFDKEKGAGVTTIPEWSVIKFKDKKLTLDVNENDNVMNWLDRAIQTLAFLKALTQFCKDSETLFDSLFKILDESLENFLADSKAEQPQTKVLH